MAANELPPLSDFAIGVLRLIAHKEMPRKTVNAGVAQRLIDGGLAEWKGGPPKGRFHGRDMFLHITDAGREVLAAARKEQL